MWATQRAVRPSISIDVQWQSFGQVVRKLVVRGVTARSGAVKESDLVSGD